MMLLRTLTVVLATIMPAFPLQSTEESNAPRQKREAKFFLPKNTIPLHYEVRLTPYLLNGNFTFHGETNITIELLKRTKIIVLHAETLTIDESLTTLTPERGNDIKPKQHKYDDAVDFLRLFFENHLMPGIYTLRFQFIGELGTEVYGFYRTSYRNENDDTVRWIAATNFQPLSARHTFPCWDEATFRATFDITIKHHPNYTALSNMPVKEQSAVEDDGLRWTTFHTTPLMGTNDVAFVLIDFDYISSADGTIKIWSTKETRPDVKYVLGIWEKARKIMEDYTEIEIHVPKIDHVVIPDDSNIALESFGLVLYSENAIAYDANYDSISTKENNIMTIIHENSRMWFANLVYPSAWHYLWMSEGFATYFKYIVADELFPEWKVFDIYGVWEMVFVLEMDTPPTTPINRKITHLNQIRIDYDSWVTYDKAGAVLRMTDHALSKNVFHQGIVTYLHENANRSVNPDDFSNALQKALDGSHIPHDQFIVTKFLSTWENQAGYPLVTVTRDYSTGETQLTQQAFVPFPNFTGNFKIDARWWIPITYATQTNPDFSQTLPKVWMKPHDNVTKIEGADQDGWIILNLQQIGVFRANYDETNWKRIVNCLNSNNYTDIHIVNRGNLINDAYSLIPTLRINPVIFIQLLSYLEREYDPVPWHPAAEIIDHMYPLIMTPEREPIFRPYILRLISNIVEHVGFEEKPYDDRGIKLLRPVIVKLACRFGHAACKNVAKENMTQYIQALKKRDDMSEEAIWITCEALWQAGDTAWQKVLDMYTEHEFVYTLMFLSCTKNANHFEKFLDLIQDEDSPIPKDAFINSAKAAMYLNPESIDIILNYLIKNKDKLKDVINSDILLWEIYTNDRLQMMIDNFSIKSSRLASVQATIAAWEIAISKIRDWLEHHE